VKGAAWVVRVAKRQKSATRGGIIGRNMQSRLKASKIWLKMAVAGVFIALSAMKYIVKMNECRLLLFIPSI
jgi:hypothetical protein